MVGGWDGMDGMEWWSGGRSGECGRRGRTDGGMPLLADDDGALDEGGARVVDALQYCLVGVGGEVSRGLCLSADSQW